MRPARTRSVSSDAFAADVLPRLRDRYPTAVTAAPGAP
jgi:hypothetical protein